MNSSFNEGGGFGVELQFLTAAATAELKIRRDGKGLSVESFLCSLSRVSRRASFDWLSFSLSRSLSFFSRLFS